MPTQWGLMSGNVQSPAAAYSAEMLLTLWSTSPPENQVGDSFAMSVDDITIFTLAPDPAHSPDTLEILLPVGGC